MHESEGDGLLSILWASKEWRIKDALSQSHRHSYVFPFSSWRYLIPDKWTWQGLRSITTSIYSHWPAMLMTQSRPALLVRSKSQLTQQDVTAPRSDSSDTAYRRHKPSHLIRADGIYTQLWTSSTSIPLSSPSSLIRPVNLAVQAPIPKPTSTFFQPFSILVWPSFSPSPTTSTQIDFLTVFRLGRTSSDDKRIIQRQR